ncbi:MAG: zf-TFIIB domain-containing protein [Planctomycetota bacterium]
MRSPVDADAVLETVVLEEGLTVMRCPSSGGIWIRPGAFWRWLEQQGDRPAGVVDLEDVVLGADSSAGKRCPEDGHFLTRRKVGAGVEFYVERCPHCGGFWLDAGEWETLRAAGLARQLHHVFSDAWQARSREQARRETAERRLESTLGAADAQRVREFAAFMKGHPERDRILGFLS